MRLPRALLALICTAGFSAPSIAETTQDILNDIIIEDISLISNATQIQTSIDLLKSKQWKCKESKREERVVEKSNKITRYARNYRWDCLYQNPEKPAEHQNLKVGYIHDRVTDIYYRGSVLPKLGDGVELVSFLKTVDQRLKKASDLPNSYNYKDYGELVGASSPYFTQGLDMKLPQECTEITDQTRRHSYTFKFNAGYQHIPEQNVNGATLSLSRAGLHRCISVIEK